MKKTSLNFITTIILALVLAQFLPWWSVMVAAFIAALFISLKRSAVFFVPFFAVASLWMGLALWMGRTNDFILAKKIAVLLPLQGHVFLLVLVTGMVGGLAAGVSGIFGKQCATLFKPN